MRAEQQHLFARNSFVFSYHERSWNSWCQVILCKRDVRKWRM